MPVQSTGNRQIHPCPWVEWSGRDRTLWPVAKKVHIEQHMYFRNKCLLKIDLGGKLKVALPHKFLSLHDRKFGLVKLVHKE